MLTISENRKKEKLAVSLMKKTSSNRTDSYANDYFHGNVYLK